MCRPAPPSAGSRPPPRPRRRRRVRALPCGADRPAAVGPCLFRPSLKEPAIPPTPDPLRSALDRFLRESRSILDAWNTYSDEATDLDGWPHDTHAYGLRASQRDRETAEAFEIVRDSAQHLLTTAEKQLAGLPARAVQNRWTRQLGSLRSALDQLDVLDEEWLATRDSLPAGAKPGTALFDDALAEHHSEAWSYLDDWATHGNVIREIHAAAQPARSPSSPAPAAARTAPGRTTTVRR
ncbi:hypothetical protein ACFXP3_02680 [Streptomyces sp. NPDC059096]|uniref:hypothetical protein n=1 Tax=Streptomyces sp. NPDC059096 TaxID=3346727 RepID=UPI0036AA0965